MRARGDQDRVEPGVLDGQPADPDPAGPEHADGHRFDVLPAAAARAAAKAAARTAALKAATASLTS